MISDTTTINVLQAEIIIAPTDSLWTAIGTDGLGPCFGIGFTN